MKRAAKTNHSSSNARLTRLIEALEKRNDDLAALSGKILQAQEEERKNVSRQLHDQVGQALTAVSVAVGALKINGGSKNFQKQMTATQRLLSDTLEAVHQFACQLRPPMLDELGLLPALRSMIKRSAGGSGLRVVFRADEAAENLSDSQKTVLFRVAQESLHHLLPRAQGSVKIAIRKYPEGICMMITHDGPAFTGALQTQKTIPDLDLLGMLERVRLINGFFSIETLQKKGARVRVLIPHLTG